MVDTLRAAFRLLPAVRPSLGGGSCGNCSRVPKARIHSPAPEQPTLLSLKAQQHIVIYEKTEQERTVFVRFARTLLKYVGASLSAVAANQFAGPSLCQAKELGSSVGENHMMAAAEARAVWQRTAANRHLVQEDAIRSPKFAHCPLPHIISKAQNDACHPVGHSYYWSNSSWGSLDTRVPSDPKLDLQWQLSPSLNRDVRGEPVGLDEPTCTRFCKPAGLQALAAETNSSLKASAELMGVASAFSSVADLELEWQLIVDSEPKSDFATTMCERRTDEEDSDTQDTNKPETEEATIHESNPSKAGTSQVVTKRKKDIATARCSQVAGVEKEHLGAYKLKLVEASESQETNFSSSIKSSSSWRTADKEELAALVASKAGERLVNCDLPTPQTMLALRSTLSTFDIGPSEKQADISSGVDRALLASLLRGNEPTRLENVNLPSSPFSVGSMGQPAARADVAGISQPLTIPSSQASRSTRRGHNLRVSSVKVRAFRTIYSGSLSNAFPVGLCTNSTDGRNTSWNGGGTSTTVDRGSGVLLGEALCHSQTRAREAEKKVEQANKERERLVHLFFQEASLSLTYRQWVTSLQYENMCLRMYAGDEPVAWLEQSFLNPFTAFERLSKNRWKNFGKDQVRRQMAVDHYLVNMWRDKDLVWHGDTNDIMMGCTLGFAFALGISLAGAGLMLGWSMGWILLAC